MEKRIKIKKVNCVLFALLILVSCSKRTKNTILLEELHPTKIFLNDNYQITLHGNFVIDSNNISSIKSHTDAKTQNYFDENAKYLKSVLRYNWIDKSNDERFFNFISNKTNIQENISNQYTASVDVQKAIIPILENEIIQNAKAFGNDLKVEITKKLHYIRINNVNVFFTEYKQSSNLNKQHFIMNSSIYYFFDGNDLISVGFSYTPENDKKWQDIRENTLKSLTKNNDR